LFTCDNLSQFLHNGNVNFAPSARFNSLCHKGATGFQGVKNGGLGRWAEAADFVRRRGA